MSRIFFVLALLAVASAFRPMAGRRATSSAMKMSVFDKATKDWAETYPAAWAKGWGPTTKAERWNGRHGTFSLTCIVSFHFQTTTTLLIFAVFLK